MKVLKNGYLQIVELRAACSPSGQGGTAFRDCVELDPCQGV